MTNAVTDQVRCNICGGETFRDVKSRRLAQCTTCFSMERTRLLWMYLQDLPVSAATRVLHLAPEKGLYKALQRKLKGARYEVADLAPERYAFAETVRKIDLCELGGTSRRRVTTLSYILMCSSMCPATSPTCCST